LLAFIAFAVGSLRFSRSQQHVLWLLSHIFG
jgi:hypothetical protein